MILTTGLLLVFAYATATSIPPLKPLSDFDGDTKEYLNFNLNNEKQDDFIGLTIGELFDCLEIDFKSFDCRIRFMERKNIPLISLYVQSLSEIEKTPSGGKIWGLYIFFDDPITEKSNPDLYKYLNSSERKSLNTETIILLRSVKIGKVTPLNDTIMRLH